MNQLNLVPYSQAGGVENSFLGHLRVMYRAGGVGDGALVLRVESIHLNVANALHGGVIMTLLDVAMARACRSFDSEGRECVTAEMKTNFMRSGGVIGDWIEARGVVRHSARSIAFCEAELKNRDGDLLATSSGTFKYLKKE